MVGIWGVRQIASPAQKAIESRKDLEHLGLIYMREKPLNENATKASKLHDKTIN